MGGIGDAIGGVLGKGGADAATDAANVQANAQTMGIKELQRQYTQNVQRMLPFVATGKAQLDNLLQGATPAGMRDRINQLLNTNTFRNLTQERQRAAGDWLSRAGLSRSGMALREVSKIPTELAFELENLLFGRQQNLAGSGQNAAAGLGAQGYQASSSIADMFNQQGQTLASGILGAQQANAQAGQNLLGLGTTLASLFFSDERLKDNMEQIGSLCGLPLYEWDWKDGVPEEVAQMTIGFKAQDVEKMHPDCVFEHASYKAIDYALLLAKLQYELAMKEAA